MINPVHMEDVEKNLAILVLYFMVLFRSVSWYFHAGGNVSQFTKVGNVPVYVSIT